MNEEAAGTDAEGIPASRKSERVIVWLYLVMWVGLIGASAYFLGPWSTTQASGVDYYRILLASGFVLTVSGPVLALLAWLIVRQGIATDDAIGLFGRIMFKTVGAGLLGVASWTIILLTLDYMRTGLG